MHEAFDRAWRRVATGICFATFGIGGLLLRLLVFPPLAWFVRAQSQRATIARSVIHRAFGLFVAMMRGLGVLSYELRGEHRLERRGLLILANHPSLIDVVFLMALVKHADCIVKAELASNPFTRGPVRAAGFVCNDSGTGMVDGCVASVRAGNNLIVFPEGTRTPRDGAVHLQRGAANVAIRGGLNITPVRIQVTPPTLAKGEPWWCVPSRRAHFVIEVGEDIDVSRFASGHRNEALAARGLTDHLSDYFFPEPAHAAH